MFMLANLIEIIFMECTAESINEACVYVAELKDREKPPNYRYSHTCIFPRYALTDRSIRSRFALLLSMVQPRGSRAGWGWELHYSACATNS